MSLHWENCEATITAGSIFSLYLFPPKESVNGYGDKEIEILC